MDKNSPNGDDLIERNEALNEKLKEADTQARPSRVLYSVLVFIIVLSLSIIVILVNNSSKRSSQLSKTNITQTQLLCAGVSNPMQYAICRQVGLPQKNGELK